jgi:NAD(P)-dependent dehydrogenase (short-subunit alcohol dehydrogenase family)
VFGVSRSSPKDLIKDSNYRHFNMDLANLDFLPRQVTQMFASIESIDLCVLNAGILGRIAHMKDVSIPELQKTFDINVWTNKILLDALFEQHERIKQVVAISSGAAVNGSLGWNGYSISKAALNMLVKLYAEEFVNVHFTAFAPGLIDTAMQDYLCEKVDTTEFPSAEKLKNARNTSGMPKPDEAGTIMMTTFEELLKGESGSFVDIRKM